MLRCLPQSLEASPTTLAAATLGSVASYNHTARKFSPQRVRTVLHSAGFLASLSLAVQMGRPPVRMGGLAIPMGSLAIQMGSLAIPMGSLAVQMGSPFGWICNPAVLNIRILILFLRRLSHYKCLYSMRSDCKSDRTRNPTEREIRPNEKSDRTGSPVVLSSDAHETNSKVIAYRRLNRKTPNTSRISNT